MLGEWLTSETRVLINPAGTFHAGGPAADAGLAGQIVDRLVLSKPASL